MRPSYWEAMYDAALSEIAEMSGEEKRIIRERHEEKAEDIVFPDGKPDDVVWP